MPLSSSHSATSVRMCVFVNAFSYDIVKKKEVPRWLEERLAPAGPALATVQSGAEAESGKAVRLPPEPARVARALFLI